MHGAHYQYTGLGAVHTVAITSAPRDDRDLEVFSKFHIIGKWSNAVGSIKVSD